MNQELSPLPWTGRDDGPGAAHRRWHHAVNTAHTAGHGTALAVLGFASDEGVRRNQGRVGAAGAPHALRAALSSLAVPATFSVRDLGDIAVSDGALEAGQARLGEAIAGILRAGELPIVLGGGHETAYGSYLGLQGSDAVAQHRVGILNLDAHFDLRGDARPSSGTPFHQIAAQEHAAGRDFRYAVVGISEPNNTAELFHTAHRLGVRYLRDEECGTGQQAAVHAFVADFLASVDRVYLTIDLDVLPAHVAPGVSAPAALGVPYEIILALCQQVARSGKLLLLDVVELNPHFDLDQRTARAAARLIHTLALGHAAATGRATVSPTVEMDPSC